MNNVSKVQDEEKPNEIAEFEIIHQKLSDYILETSDPYYSDYAALVLQLLTDKNWDDLSFLTDNSFYTSYVTESSGSLVDYCMFMLHTGDKGISTNYSLNEVEKAYYTGIIEKENSIIYEGLYLFHTGETEYFKILIKDDGNGLILTRE